MRASEVCVQLAFSGADGPETEVRPSASSGSGVPQIGLPNDRPTENPRSVAFCFDRSLSRHFQFHPACSSATAILQWVLFRYSDGLEPSNTPNLPTSDTAPI